MILELLLQFCLDFALNQLDSLRWYRILPHVLLKQRLEILPFFRNLIGQFCQFILSNDHFCKNLSLHHIHLSYELLKCIVSELRLTVKLVDRPVFQHLFCCILGVFAVADFTPIYFGLSFSYWLTTAQINIDCIVTFKHGQAVTQ